MVVGGFVGAVDMGMGVQMGMLMGVDGADVAVFVGMGVGMLVGVLEGDGVEDHQRRGRDHHSQAQEKPQIRPLSQKHHAEEDPQEGGDGVISAGLCRAQVLRGLDVEIDAHAVG